MRTPLPVQPVAFALPAQSPETPTSLVVVLAVTKNDIQRYPVPSATVYAADTTGAAMESIERLHPRVVVVDWDVTTIDGGAVCRAVTPLPSITVMITTDAPERVPDALKSGCHAVLLKPFSVNLAAARLGRLCRDATITRSPSVRATLGQGTNRHWPRVECPSCGQGGAISFDFASHRTWWYACGACDHVWRGPRQE